MSPGLSEWMRSTGSALRMHAGVSGLRLLDGVSVPVFEKSDPRVGGRAFDIVSVNQVVEATEGVGEFLVGKASGEPPLFFLDRDHVYAVKTREGAVALVEILEEPNPGPTRLRYKLVEPETTARAALSVNGSGVKGEGVRTSAS